MQIDTEQTAKIEKKLAKFSIDITSAKYQFAGNMLFYFTMLNKFCNNTDIDNLCAAAAADNAEKIFQYAHALKGLSGLLYLTPIFTECVQLTTAFKAGDIQTVIKKAPHTGKKIRKFRDKLRVLLANVFPKSPQ